MLLMTVAVAEGGRTAAVPAAAVPEMSAPAVAAGALQAQGTGEPVQFSLLPIVAEAVSC